MHRWRHIQNSTMRALASLQWTKRGNALRMHFEPHVQRQVERTGMEFDALLLCHYSGEHEPIWEHLRSLVYFNTELRARGSLVNHKELYSKFYISDFYTFTRALHEALFRVE